MTTLAITPNHDKKRLKFSGTVAAGEHVAVTVSGGADWIKPNQSSEGQTLRLRVIFGDKTVAVFPRPDETGDEWETAGSGNADAVCELNLNSIPAEKYLKCGGNCLWVLDDTENHTLYGMGEFEVGPWPKLKPADVPYDLDGYPDFVKEMKAEWEAYKVEVDAELEEKYEKPNSGIPKSDLASDVQTSLDKADSAIQQHQDISGKADLVDGKVPASELPSYVDDVIEVANYAALPAEGEQGKIYVTLDTNKVYRWSGSVYVEISPAPSIPVTDVTVNGTSVLDGTVAKVVVPAQVNADWNASSGAAQILNKPTLGTAASRDVGTTSGTVAAGDDSRIVNAVPKTRKVNNKALSADISLTASDVGAVPTTGDSVIHGSVAIADGLVVGSSEVPQHLYTGEVQVSLISSSNNGCVLIAPHGSVRVSSVSACSYAGLPIASQSSGGVVVLSSTPINCSCSFANSSGAQQEAVTSYDMSLGLRYMIPYRGSSGGYDPLDRQISHLNRSEIEAAEQAFILLPQQNDSNAARDFIVDVDYRTDDSSATAHTLRLGSNYGTAWRVCVAEGEDLTDMLTFNPGEVARLYFTETAFRVGSSDNTPVFLVARQNVDMVEVSA